MIHKKDFIDYLYNKLPSVYREEDLKLDKPLYRYLSSLSAGGFEKVLEDSNNFLTLVDPEKCPEHLFPYLYGSFGFEYFQDIPISYHRKFLKNLGALLKRRGTYAEVRYLVSTLTGFEVELSYEREYNDKGESIARHLNVLFIVDTVEQAQSIEVTTKVIEQFIQSQIPFYITPHISADVNSVMISSTNYTAGAISYGITQTVSPLI